MLWYHSGIKSYIFSCFKVIAQGIATLLKLGNKLSDDKILMMRLVTVAKDNLKDTSHQVKCRCLQLISELYPIIPELDRTTEMISEANAIVKLLGDYSNAEVNYVLYFLDLDCFLIYSRVGRGNSKWTFVFLLEWGNVIIMLTVTHLSSSTEMQPDVNCHIF